MTTIDDFFTKPAESLHPRLRDWKRRLAEEGASATVEVSRPETELGEARPELHLQFTKGGTLLPLESVPWDDDLNEGLIQEMPKPVRATNADQEAERFALGLRAALRKTEREFGDGYFNAVLLELLKESDLVENKAMADVIRHAYANSPFREGKAFDRYTMCREMIASAISGRAAELSNRLGYPRDEAKKILVAALARYLDERFSVSSRRRMGLI